MARSRRQREQKAELKLRKNSNLAQPFGVLMWHPDGKPFSISDYKKAGMNSPAQALLKKMNSDA